MSNADLFRKIEALGIEYSSHFSDLYIPVTEETKLLISSYMFKQNVQVFICNITKKPWYDVPFAFMPYWERQGKYTASKYLTK